MTVGRAELVHLAGHGCAAGEPMVARLAFGLASPREAGQAQIHLAGCPQCALLYERLDVWRERVAALVPVPAVEPARPGLVDWTLQRASEAAASRQATRELRLRARGRSDAGRRGSSRRRRRGDRRLPGDRRRHHVLRNAERRPDQRPRAGRGSGARTRTERRRAAQEAPVAGKRRDDRHGDTDGDADANATPTATPVATPTSAPPTATVQATPEPTPEPTPPPVPEEEYEPRGPGHGGDDRATDAAARARQSRRRRRRAGRGVRAMSTRARLEEETMRSRQSRPSRCRSHASVIAAIGVRPIGAAAGEFSVANCQADPLNYSTRAFEDFATRGMTIRRACDPEGPGLRGLITQQRRAPRTRAAGRAWRWRRSAPRPGRASPPSAGRARRAAATAATRCSCTPRRPTSSRSRSKNVRANRAARGPRRRPDQQASARSHSTSSAPRGSCSASSASAATAGPSCSARGAKLHATYEADIRHRRRHAPAAAIIGDTPLARGEWVGGMQPLNYDASDNVGVRVARAFHRRRRPVALHNRPCMLASPEGPYADRVPCPNGPGQIAVRPRRFAEGTHALVVQAQDAAGNVGKSARVTARIDNTPPARVDVERRGGRAGPTATTSSSSGRIRRSPIGHQSSRQPPGCARLAGRRARAPSTAGRASLASASRSQHRASSRWSCGAATRPAMRPTGNASVPVTLRYDPEPPQLAFEPPPAGDPTLVAVQANDRVSGVAGGAIEIGPAGSGTWQTLTPSGRAAA